MTDWTLVYDHYNPKDEGVREVICTLGNGYFATRGAAMESRADDVHYPGTYIAGCFNRLKSRVADREIEDESLVNVPNWLDCNFRLPEDDWFSMANVELLDYRQELDFQHGLLKRCFRLRDKLGRHTSIEQYRLVSMHRPHLAALRLCVKPEDWSGVVKVRAGLDGSVVNGGVKRYRALASQHLTPLMVEAVDDHTQVLEVSTTQSRIHIAMAADIRFWAGNETLLLNPIIKKAPRFIEYYYDVPINDKKPLHMEKVVALYTSRDRAISEPGLEARKMVRIGGGFRDLCIPHGKRWRHLWRRFNLDIVHDDPEEEEETERILRLHIFHLLQTYSPHVADLDAGVPARGLHGEAYRGHIFWDELFVLPLLHLRMPEVSRAHLMYRYRRLDQARRDARAAGFSGAMYPWQSGSDGREESQFVHLNPKSGNWIPDNSRLQRHISAGVAFSVCHYYQATRDDEFMVNYGAEMLLEIARFWASAVIYNPQRDRYEIHHVMGPDEYHDGYPGSDQPGLNNNAYTNVMAAWVLVQAMGLRDILTGQNFEELSELLELNRDELDYWDEISRKMYIPFHSNGIISQFEGYEKLEEFDWESYRAKYGDIQRLDRILEAEGDTPNHYKASKQADVLMLFYLFSSGELDALFTRLGYPFMHENIPRIIDYYLDRTSHGSTLSRVTHSWVLARADRPGSWPLFKEALQSDIRDIQGGTTAEGIHAGAMAGTVDLVQRCFTGLDMWEGVLWLRPRLPKGVSSLTMDICYRKHSIRIYMTPNYVRVETDPSKERPIHVGIDKQIHTMHPGELREFIL